MPHDTEGQLCREKDVPGRRVEANTVEDMPD